MESITGRWDHTYLPFQGKTQLAILTAGEPRTGITCGVAAGQESGGLAKHGGEQNAEHRINAQGKELRWIIPVHLPFSRVNEEPVSFPSLHSLHYLTPTRPEVEMVNVHS